MNPQFFFRLISVLWVFVGNFVDCDGNFWKSTKTQQCHKKKLKPAKNHRTHNFQKLTKKSNQKIFVKFMWVADSRKVRFKVRKKLPRADWDWRRIRDRLVFRRCGRLLRGCLPVRESTRPRFAARTPVSRSDTFLDVSEIWFKLRSRKFGQIHRHYVFLRTFVDIADICRHCGHLSTLRTFVNFSNVCGHFFLILDIFLI